MKSTEAKSVEEYIGSLPEEKGRALEEVRKVILENLPPGYEETIAWGMITYQVSLDRYPNTYNGKPLMYAALTSQSKHMSLYLTAIYMNEQRRKRFDEEYRATGKRLDAAKSCVRFKRIEDLPLDLVARSVAELSVDEFIAETEEALKNRKKK
jgi:hypothetical protein